MNKEYERELEKENEPVLCGKKKNKKAKKSKKNKKKNKKDDVEAEIIHVSVYNNNYTILYIFWAPCQQGSIFLSPNLGTGL